LPSFAAFSPILEFLAIVSKVAGGVVLVKPGNGHLAFIFRRKKDGQILDLYTNLLFPAIDPFLVLFEGGISNFPGGS